MYELPRNLIECYVCDNCRLRYWWKRRLNGPIFIPWRCYPSVIFNAWSEEVVSVFAVSVIAISFLKIARSGENRSTCVRYCLSFLVSGGGYGSFDISWQFCGMIRRFTAPPIAHVKFVPLYEMRRHRVPFLLLQNRWTWRFHKLLC